MGNIRPNKLLFVLAFLAAHPALAAEWAAEVGASAIHTSNIQRTPFGESTALSMIDGTGQYLTRRRTALVDLELAAQRRDYFGGDFDSETVAQARLDAEWSPFPERFKWILRDNLGQVALSPSASLLPGDSETVNVATTGPSLAWPIGAKMNLGLGALYSDVNYEEANFDYTRNLGRLVVDYAFSRNQTVYLAGTVSRTKYQDSTLPSYDLQGAYFGFDGVARRSNILVEVGSERLKFQGENRTGAYVDFNLDRHVARRISLSARIVSRYANSADIFALDQDLIPSLGGVSNVRLTGEPIRQKRASIGLIWTGRRTEVGTALLWNTESVTSLSLPDRDIYGLNISLEHKFSSRTTFVGNAYLLREKRTTLVNESQDDFALLLGVNSRITAKLSVQGQFEQFKRSNSPGDYTESRFLIGIRYAPRPLREGLPSFAERQFRRRVGAPQDQFDPDGSQPDGTPAIPQPSRPPTP